jgi:putative oxidoreductase
MPSFAALDRIWAPQVLSLLRFVAGLLFLSVGIAKYFGIPPVPMFANLPPLLWVQGMIELVGGTLMVLGLLTRPTAFILSGNMAVAYFYGHFPRSFFPVANNGSAAILFCFVFFYIFFAGPGPWSLDHRLGWERAA